MKTMLLCLAVGFILALLGCTPEQTAVQVTTTRAVVTSPAETSTPSPAPATETPLPPTFTAVSVTLKPSQTPVSPTATSAADPTSTPLPDPTLEPFTPGSILILWNEAPTPSPDEAPEGGSMEFEPTVNLYLAQPGSMPEDWEVQPLLTNLRALAPAYLSPDQTKLAFLNYEPGASRGCLCDFYKIQVYNLLDKSLLQVDNAEYLDTLSWLPDSQSIVFPQEKDIFVARLDETSPQLITNNSDSSSDWFEGQIGQLVSSPDGRFQALNVYPDGLAIFKMDSGETFQVTDGLGRDHLTLKWSPNSQWLAFTPDFNQGLFVVNAHTLQITDLATESTPHYYFPAWAPDSKHLAFSQQNTLFLWDSETHLANELTNSDYMSEPSWSPDGSRIAAGFIQGEQNGIMVIDPGSGQRQDFPLEIFTNSVIWSPDGQWLLFPLVQSDKSGLYVMSIEEGMPYLILDTSGKLHIPKYITWLSNAVGPKIGDKP
ncbi:MAG: hypothetical protein HND44_02395 [Chloroflexi bacterium]|nr:PD40 domain-containing protein [Ardenticatenaceae bacterium]MBL1127349.1 hypothetical protein [Chloroflexota bacterium]NOG33410.1 hypothetical protein [Chloroflexota bacterium]GIK57187.1 MAG: hypothetical protein BroJett015_28500 [Chloroflexota bacterium]